MILMIIKVKCKIITRSSDRVFQLSQCWNDFLLQSVRNCSTRPLLFQRPGHPTMLYAFGAQPPLVGQLLAIRATIAFCWKFILKFLEPIFNVIHTCSIFNQSGL